ncbi:hypothetical protein [Streptosporangium sp. NPDC049078]|uniref:hypothetical protein n=1 Tax=Streptosporangium sp. NPDC049078 TaxID=3155767 RepID=UPI0034339AC2
MAFTRSFAFVDPQVQWHNAAITLDYGDTTPGVYMGALWTDTITPLPSQATPKYGVAPWDSGEVAGAAPGYDTGGLPLPVLSFAELVGTPGKAAWLVDPLLWTEATFEASGLLAYRASDDLALVFHWFGPLGPYDAADGDYEVVPDPTEGFWRRSFLGPT